MDLRGKRLAIVVSTPGVGGDLERAAELALTARLRGVDVELFIMSDAVLGLASRAGLAAELTDEGCHLVACATSADMLGACLESLEGAGVLLGSQDDHAAALGRADRVVAFT